jgi:phage terminase large subunit-like protein
MVEHFRAWSASKRLKDGSLFVLDEWQALFLEDLFARDADGLPVFSELWLIVPEGNGKTTFTSLLALYVIEHTAEAWCPIAASARDQAVALTYRIASGFVERNDLAYVLHPGYREIRHEGSKGTLKIFASDAASGDGVDPVGFALIEELHRLPTLDLYETWSGKLEKSGAQLVVVSTAGEPGSPFEVLRESFRQGDEVTRDGCFTRSVSTGSVIHDYALPEDGDVEDLALVAAANPSPRKTVESMAKKRAKKSWNLAHWRRFTCNLPTRGGLAAITEAEWYAAAVPERIPEGEPIWLGMDVAWKWDTTALVPLYWASDEMRLFGPATILEPPRDGTALAPSLIHQALMEIHARNPIHTVVMDPSNATELTQWIEDTIGCIIVERAQTNAFAVADYEYFMEGLGGGKLHHTGDPGLTKHVLNGVARLLPDGKIRFDRPKDSRRSGEQPMHVVDALSAAAMVHSEATIASARAMPSAVLT